MLLSIGIVSTNERQFLEICLKELLMNIPAGIEHEIAVIDNSSMDGTKELIKERYPSIVLLVNDKKIGFAQNLNTLIRESKGDYFMILDANAFVTPGYISSLISALDRNKKCAVVSGKLLKVDDKGKPVLSSNKKYIIDSTGHVIGRDYRVINRGELEEDMGQYDISGTMFGVCTAATMFRRSALEAITVGEEYFDESFYSHKEDVDICWRALLFGYECHYEAASAAFHCRSWSKGRDRRFVPKISRINSFKNRYLMVIKNESPINFVLNLPFVLWYEARAFLRILLAEQFLFSAYLEVIRLLPATMKKRREIQGKAKPCRAEMRSWFK